jgi:hypothetical protein
MKRKDYLAKLDAFLLNLAGDSQQGLVLGFEERHGEHLNWLLRHRKDLDDAARKGNPRVTDGLDAAEKALHEVRAALRNGV